MLAPRWRAGRASRLATVLVAIAGLLPATVQAHAEPPRPVVAPPRAPSPAALANAARSRSTQAAVATHGPVPATPAVGSRPVATPPASIILHRQRDFEQPLDRTAIRTSSSFLSDTTFAKKWSAALVSPLLFFRSFPSAYYRDLRAIAARGVPGGQGIILGDPHPENFGFVRTAGGTEFAFNDFDDSGRGPVAIDALRYFTALRLAYPDKPHVFARTLDAYIDGVQHSTSEKPPSSVKPHWADVRAENLKSFTKDKRFLVDEKTQLSPAPSRLAGSVRSLVEKDPRFGAARVLDIALRARDHGGSGGLQRIWVLTERQGEEPRIIELKESGPPATDELAGETLPPRDRIALLKTVFLKNPASDDLFSVELGGKLFVVRDRDRMSSVALADLTKPEAKELLDAQASVMANVHRSGWAGVDEHEMRKWLSGSSETLAGRWESAYKAAKE